MFDMSCCFDIERTLVDTWCQLTFQCYFCSKVLREEGMLRNASESQRIPMQVLGQPTFSDLPFLYNGDADIPIEPGASSLSFQVYCESHCSYRCRLVLHSACFVLWVPSLQSWQRDNFNFIPTVRIKIQNHAVRIHSSKSAYCSASKSFSSGTSLLSW